MSDEEARINADKPVSDARFFNFNDYAEVLAKIATSEKTETPLVIGIFGDWGSGKTSLMKTMEKKIKNYNNEKVNHLTIWFNAWKYDKEDAIWRALLTRILEEIRIAEELKTGFSWKDIPRKESEAIRFLEYLKSEHQIAWNSKPNIKNESDSKIKVNFPDKDIYLEFDKSKLEVLLKIDGKKLIEFVAINVNDDLKLYEKDLYNKVRDLQKSLYKEIHREEPGTLTFDWKKAGKGMLRLGLSVLPYIGEGFIKTIEEVDKDAINTLSEAIQREKIATNIEKVQFIEQFHDRFEKIIKENYVKKEKRAIIFIDDLDRCLPKKVIEIMEAIKLFLDAEGCIFVLGIDKKVISSSVCFKYGNLRDENGKMLISGEEYLEKIIQFSFVLPPILNNKLEEFITDCDPEKTYKNYYTMIINGIGCNPRKIKRFINTIEFQLKLVETIEDIKKAISDEYKQIFNALLIEWQILSNGNPDFDKFRKEVSKKPELLIKMHKYIVSEEKLKLAKKPLFSWEEISGNNNERLKEFLTQNFVFDFKNANIEKTDNKIVRVNTGKNSLSLILDRENNKINLEIDGIKGEFFVESNNDKLNIYKGKLIPPEVLSTYLNDSIENLIRAFPYDWLLNESNIPDIEIIRNVIHLSSVTGIPEKPEIDGAEKPMTREDVENAIKMNKSLEGANLEGMDLRELTMKMNLNYANLVNANLFKADLSYASLIGVNLRAANLSGANLNNANLKDAKLVRASLIGAVLKGASLMGADLRMANLSRTNLEYADLGSTILEDSLFFEANLKSVNLTNSKLHNSMLVNVNLEGADLSFADIRNANFKSAIFDEGTRLDGVDINLTTLDNLPESALKAKWDPHIKQELKKKFKKLAD